MSIRWKLLLSNLIMIAVPIIFSMFLGMFLIIKYSSHNIKGKTTTKFEEKFVDVINSWSELVYMANNEPSGKINNIEYLKKVDEKFKKLNAGIVVEIDGKIFYKTELIDNQSFQDLKDDKTDYEFKEHTGNKNI